MDFFLTAERGLDGASLHLHVDVPINEHVWSIIASFSFLSYFLRKERHICPFLFCSSFVIPNVLVYTAKNEYRKFETNFPRKGIARLQP